MEAKEWAIQELTGAVNRLEEKIGKHRQAILKVQIYEWEKPE